MKPVHVRFDRRFWSDLGWDRRMILNVDLPQVPDVGETINIGGDPYVVHDRGWALGDAQDDYRLFAYVTLMRIKP